MLGTPRRLVVYVLAVGALALAGSVDAQNTCAPDSQQLIIYHAGSLTAAFSPVEKLLTQQTGICVIDVAAGSVDAARRVTAGQEPCDIYASADYEDIDLLLKPAGYANYNILFAQGGMVLAYTTTSKNADSIAAPNSTFNPPASVPEAAANWYTQLTQPGVTIGGSHPFLDPSGYRADLIFQLTEDHSGVPNLYDTLLTHYSINKSTDALGKTYDYQIIYEHSALAAYNADSTKTYRYVKLPNDINLSDPDKNAHYHKARIRIPGLRLPYTAPTVRIPGTRVIWGLTVLKTAPHPENALKFLQRLFSSQGVMLQTATGPAPISPPVVSRTDYTHLPDALQSLVSVQPRDH
jgi:molybdate/tungstate transport system substrate-binding protein